MGVNDPLTNECHLEGRLIAAIAWEYTYGPMEPAFQKEIRICADCERAPRTWVADSSSVVTQSLSGSESTKWENELRCTFPLGIS